VPTYVAPAALVAAPARTALPFGLGSVLGWRNGDRFESGVTWTSLPCQPALGRAGESCQTDAADDIPGLPKDIENAGGPVPGYADSFIVMGMYRCLSVGTSVTEAQQWAELALMQGEEARAEQALWFGDLGNVPNLTGANGFPPPVTAGAHDTAVAALAAVEDKMAREYLSQGVIHVSRRTATLLGRHVDRQGTRLFTRNLGTPIVAGTGYPDTPDIVGTPPLFGYRSEVFNPSGRAGDLFDTQYNWMNAVAERSYLIGFDPCDVIKATYTGEVVP
jgi:hypothetical protein